MTDKLEEAERWLKKQAREGETLHAEHPYVVCMGALQNERKFERMEKDFKTALRAAEDLELDIAETKVLVAEALLPHLEKKHTGGIVK